MWGDLQSRHLRMKQMQYAVIRGSSLYHEKRSRSGWGGTSSSFPMDLPMAFHVPSVFRRSNADRVTTSSSACGTNGVC